MIEYYVCSKDGEIIAPYLPGVICCAIPRKELLQVLGKLFDVNYEISQRDFYRVPEEDIEKVKKLFRQN